MADHASSTVASRRSILGLLGGAVAAAQIALTLEQAVASPVLPASPDELAKAYIDAIRAEGITIRSWERTYEFIAFDRKTLSAYQRVAECFRNQTRTDPEFPYRVGYELARQERSQVRLARDSFQNGCAVEGGNA